MKTYIVEYNEPDFICITTDCPEELFNEYCEASKDTPCPTDTLLLKLVNYNIYSYTDSMDAKIYKI